MQSQFWGNAVHISYLIVVAAAQRSPESVMCCCVWLSVIPKVKQQFRGERFTYIDLVGNGKCDRDTDRQTDDPRMMPT